VTAAGCGLDIAALLAEQSAYYRAVAEEYERHAIPRAWGGEPVAALDAFAPAGQVLELACGQGVWTRQLMTHADSVTALDASGEMLAIAASRVRDERLRFVQADLFEWDADRCYDVVFFGFWLSHVPLERFESFWARVEGWLEPTGRVFFVDDAHRGPQELVFGEASEVVQRRCQDGSTYRVVKVPHRPTELERRLRDLGWGITVTGSSTELFYWGAGGRA
jgi:demethylmenaquinone methyltransferase/2-methoxy-6-polyprenyl-1,4-benzoquinol methylase